MGTAALARYRAHKKPLLKRCGAKSKNHGGKCQNLALENGRCKYHGGLTPKGDQWHRRQFPEPTSEHALRKIDRKLQMIARDEQRRLERVAAMTPEERQRYENRRRGHRPGTASERAMRSKAYRDAEKVLGAAREPREAQ
ncbi:MAG: hypothetical protein KDA48_15305, partial [Amphiplicatus sp.]|nr:hypothetical protein [Amphiplicatus sp.]